MREEGEGTAERNLRAAAEEDATALLTAAQLDGVQLSLTLCDDAFIHALNREYRSVDRPTDVLSFPLDDDVLLGDVVISLDTAAAQAAQRGHELRDELRVLLVHGLLHVLGYDHELGCFVASFAEEHVHYHADAVAPRSALAALRAFLYV